MILDRILSPLKDAGPLALRLALGAVFLYHGAHKTGILGEAGFSEAIAGAVKAAELAGFKGAFWGYALAFTELLGGALLVLGLFTRVAAVSLGFVMFIALWKVHLPNGFSSRAGGYEYNLVLLAGCLSLLLQGGGWLAVDALFGRGGRATP